MFTAPGPFSPTLHATPRPCRPQGEGLRSRARAERYSAAALRPARFFLQPSPAPRVAAMVFLPAPTRRRNGAGGTRAPPSPRCGAGLRARERPGGCQRGPLPFAAPLPAHSRRAAVLAAGARARSNRVFHIPGRVLHAAPRRIAAEAAARVRAAPPSQNPAETPIATARQTTLLGHAGIWASPFSSE